jgi:Mrp family chromosome partitioning ATPase
VNNITPTLFARGNLPAPGFLTIGAANHLAYMLRQDQTGCSVVQLVAALAREGTSSMARDLCLVAARYSPIRVLLVDVAAPGREQAEWFRDNLRQAVTRSLSLDGLPPDILLHEVSAGALWVTELRLARGTGAADWILALSAFRAAFDLVVLDSPALATSYDAVMLAPHVDQNVLVVAAEATRSAVARSLRDRIHDVGGSICGTILNKRRFHIPRALHRFL